MKIKIQPSFDIDIDNFILNTKDRIKSLGVSYGLFENRYSFYINNLYKINKELYVDITIMKTHNNMIKKLKYLSYEIYKNELYAYIDVNKIRENKLKRILNENKEWFCK